MQHPRTSILVAAALVLIGAGPGCDSYGEIRAGLDEAGAARFDRGMRAAVPCWSCHDVTGTAIKVGPPLRGLMGSRAGHLSDYPASPALANAGVVWTPGTLDAFLADPARTIPGNRMTAPGIGDAATRADLVFFLGLVTRPQPDVMNDPGP